MSTETGSTSGSLALRPRARLLRTFGDELISSEVVAVIELVKNAYDADATRVLIRFHPEDEKSAGKIEVMDNGHGMTLETVLSAWMEPATSFKRHDTRSPRFHRRMTGEKGIGRFAASKLANFLEVVSRKQNTSDEVRVFFDWKQFDDDTKYLDQVESLWEQTPPNEVRIGGLIEEAWREDEPHDLAECEHGTILRMEGRRDSWDGLKYATLHTALARLVPPKLKNEGVVRIDDFSIILDLPAEHANMGGVVSPPDILQNPPYEISGDVRSDGTYDLSVVIQGRNEHLAGRFTLPQGRTPTCGPFYIEFRVWDLEAAALASLVGLYGSRLKDVREELKRVAGVSVYRDGFRVLPYGEPKNDWLRLDVRRVNNPTLRVSNNQMLGFVMISADQNPQLRDQSNREGLMETQALEDLRTLSLMAISEIEARRYTARRQDETATQPKAARKSIFADFSLGNLQRQIRQTRPADKDLQLIVDEASRQIDEKVDEVQQVLSRYHRLATLGGLVDTVLHDGRAPLAKVRNEAMLALRTLRKVKDPSSTVLGSISSLEMIAVQAEVLSTVFRKIEPFAGRKRGRPAKLFLEDAIASAFSVLDRETAEAGITVSLPEGKTEVTLDSAEIQEVILNLLQNSIYWLQQVPAGERRIEVRVSRMDSKELEIIFADSGPGVPQEYRESIFEPYFSTKPEGVGLGLAIAGEIIKDSYDGDLELLDTGPLPGACFRLILRKRV